MNVFIFIGVVIGCICVGIVSDYFVFWMVRYNRGILEVEFRLYFFIVIVIIGLAGLLMFGIGIVR